MKVAYFASAVLLSVALAFPQLLPRACDIQCTTDTLLFTDNIDTFEAARNARNPPTLDWSSDNCSDSPDNVSLAYPNRLNVCESTPSNADHFCAAVGLQLCPQLSTA